MKVEPPPNPPDMGPSRPILYRPRPQLIREFFVPKTLRRGQQNAQSDIEQYGVGNQNLQGNIQQIKFGRKSNKKNHRRYGYTEAPLIELPKVRT